MKKTLIIALLCSFIALPPLVIAAYNFSRTGAQIETLHDLIDAISNLSGIVSISGGSASAPIVLQADCESPAITSGACIDTDTYNIWRYEGGDIVLVGAATELLGTNQILGNLGGGAVALNFVSSITGSSTDSEVPTAEGVWDLYDTFSGGGWSSNLETSVPSSPQNGNVYAFDASATNPLNSEDTTQDYLSIYLDDSWQPLWNLDGTPIVMTQEPLNPRLGWPFYYTDNSTWVVDSSVSVTNYLYVKYNGSGWLARETDAGIILMDSLDITHSTSDGESTGEYVTMTVDSGQTETSFGQAYHIDTDGELIAADADVASAASMPVYCLALVSGTGSKNCLVKGTITETDWNWTVGGYIYASDDPTTTEGLTQTAPSTAGDQVQVLGLAVTADTIYFNPTLVLVEVPTP